MQQAEIKYKGRTDIDKQAKVEIYLKEFMFTREKNAYKHKTDTYADWLIELESNKIVELLKAWKPTFKADFDSYATKSIIDNEPVMDSKIMYNYCNKKSIIPDLLNRQI